VTFFVYDVLLFVITRTATGCVFCSTCWWNKRHVTCLQLVTVIRLVVSGVVNESVINIWSLCGHWVSCQLLVCGQWAGGQLSLCGQLVSGQYMVIVWSLSQWSVVIVWFVCGQLSVVWSVVSCQLSLCGQQSLCSQWSVCAVGSCHCAVSSHYV